MTAVIIYFSRAGENYLNGAKQMIPIGNTAVLAEKISCTLTIPAYQLMPKVPYSVNYDEAVQQAEREKEVSAMIEYEELPIDFTQVKTVFLGFPNWWGTFPRVVATFLADQDWSKKEIYPFCTHEGSAFGSSIQDLATACSGAEIKTGLAVRGSKAGHSETAVENWLLTYSS